MQRNYCKLQNCKDAESTAAKGGKEGRFSVVVTGVGVLESFAYEGVLGDGEVLSGDDGIGELCIVRQRLCRLRLRACEEDDAQEEWRGIYRFIYAPL